ncbi:hypothetical protein GQ44DRAFT_436668 [Phaeosphaeriaceae sp. PMI808]|nr:hypothetical protein GQ44DRAFT_436668 [Phaeosphaeriaceae sp. PMI808]
MILSFTNGALLAPNPNSPGCYRVRCRGRHINATLLHFSISLLDHHFLASCHSRSSTFARNASLRHHTDIEYSSFPALSCSFSDSKDIHTRVCHPWDLCIPALAVYPAESLARSLPLGPLPSHYSKRCSLRNTAQCQRVPGCNCQGI